MWKLTEAISENFSVRKGSYLFLHSPVLFKFRLFLSKNEEIGFEQSIELKRVLERKLTGSILPQNKTTESVLR